jgi:DNA-directed RNA polymerase subunit M/transcription elongation factor TFIIS
MNNEVSVRCIRCGHTWLVDVAKLGKPSQVLYKGTQIRLKVSTYKVVCPQCGTMNMLDVTTEETRNDR